MVGKKWFSNTHHDMRFLVKLLRGIYLSKLQVSVTDDTESPPTRRRQRQGETEMRHVLRKTGPLHVFKVPLYLENGVHSQKRWSCSNFNLPRPPNGVRKLLLASIQRDDGTTSSLTLSYHRFISSNFNTMFIRASQESLSPKSVKTISPDLVRVSASKF